MSEVACSTIYWPSCYLDKELTKHTAYLIGYNISEFVGCVTTLVPQSKIDQTIKKPTELNEQLTTLTTRSIFHSEMCKYCHGPPSVIGVYLIDEQTKTGLAKVGRATSSFWLTIEKGENGLPVVEDIHCCGFRFQTTSKIIFYDQPHNHLRFYYLESTGKKTDIETTLRHINASKFITNVVNELISEFGQKKKEIEKGNKPAIKYKVEKENEKEKENGKEKEKEKEKQIEIEIVNEKTRSSRGREDESEHVEDKKSIQDEKKTPKFRKNKKKIRRNRMGTKQTGEESENENSTDFENDEEGEEEEFEREKDDLFHSSNESDENEFIRESYSQISESSEYSDGTRSSEEDEETNLSKKNPDHQAKDEKINNQTIYEKLNSKSNQPESLSQIKQLRVPYYYQIVSIFAMMVLRFYLIIHTFLNIRIRKDFPLWKLTIFGTQLNNKLTRYIQLCKQYYFHHNVWNEERRVNLEYINFMNSVVGFIFDTLLGWITGIFVLKNLRMMIGLISKEYLDLINILLTRGIIWLSSGAPAGLKLNDDMNNFIGTIFLLGIRIWKSMITKLYVYIFQLFILIGMSSCLGGLSIMLSLASDLLLMSTSLIYFFYYINSKIVKFLLHYMFSFLLLFSGKKRNILRKRNDSCQYSIGQLLLGTIFFTLITFLLPTFLAYYLLFMVIHLALELGQLVLGIVILILNYLPLFQIFTHIFRSHLTHFGVSFAPFKDPQTKNEQKTSLATIRSFPSMNSFSFSTHFSLQVSFLDNMYA
ncbi:phosphatidylinositol n-acetylglucosaminyltransferase subunit q-related [Anaeramoeba flamelloides]|uniref:Phosphatidylinositol n-acetylglucosaminyltransferase subunit q-related n=1 Tax=Anaeramoeba flamelloides TaxID=1746091 RepID=A0AAV8AJC3_9EUKA|nr:phosphatidylinositol n-acetylglucosaminyltransferase subunit q-related [Anaeramoeba flamelloides]